MSKANVGRGAKTGQPIEGTACSACLIRHSTYYAAVMSGNGEHFELFAQINGSTTMLLRPFAYAHNCWAVRLGGAVPKDSGSSLKYTMHEQNIYLKLYMAEKHVNSTCTENHFVIIGYCP